MHTALPNWGLIKSPTSFLWGMLACTYHFFICTHQTC